MMTKCENYYFNHKCNTSEILLQCRRQSKLSMAYSLVKIFYLLSKINNILQDAMFDVYFL